MKYYAIKMAENQYNVLEVDGSDKIGVYQVDELFVRQMYKQSKQKKLDFVIQEADGAILYLDFSIISNLLFYEKPIMFVSALINMFLVYMAYYKAEYRVLFFLAIIILNVGIIYLYHKMFEKGEQSYFPMGIQRLEIKGRGSLISKEKRFIKTRIINLIFLLVFCCFVILLKETNVFPLVNDTYMLLFCNLAVVGFDYFALWERFRLKEMYDNYRGMQPIMKSDLSIEWHADNQIKKKELPPNIGFNA